MVPITVTHNNYSYIVFISFTRLARRNSRQSEAKISSKSLVSYAELLRQFHRERRRIPTSILQLVLTFIVIFLETKLVYSKLSVFREKN